MSKSSGTVSAEETEQLENNESRVSQGVEQISGGGNSGTKCFIARAWNNYGRRNF